MWSELPAVDEKKKGNEAIRLCNMPDSEIYRKTELMKRNDLLAMIVLICNGDMNKMGDISTKLTSFEEWMLFFEVLWGNSSRDGRMLLQKALLLSVRAVWPINCSQEEDELLHDTKWVFLGKGKLYVFWDTTNVDLRFKPSSAYEQGITYNTYYSRHCAKGGVFNHLCGWLGNHHLWSGRMSDTMYQEMTGILQQQEQFAKEDLIDGKYLQIVMNLDTGYRITMAAWKHGQQTSLQPIFMNSGRTFTTDDVVYTSTVASHRAGNERCVKLSKQSGFIKRGIY